MTATLFNLLLLYVVYQVARMVYLFVNYSYFEQGLTFGHLMEMLGGSLVFDTSAILVTNIPYIVLMLFPLHLKETRVYQLVCKWVYLVINGLALAVNLCDAVYFQYTMRRTTTTVFNEFSNENNLSPIFLTETIHHAYLLVVFALLMWGLWKLYRHSGQKPKYFPWWRYDVAMLLSMALFAPFVVAGIRGGFTTAVRPITISNANQYVDRPVEAALVLNTPFSLYRTIGKAVFVVPDYYQNKREMEAVYNPVHRPDSSGIFSKKNVVVLIVESFGREYIGALNRNLENGQYKGYTPCVDSLISKSITFTYSFCNGRKSIDGMPSILSSIPMFVEPFFLTPASMNHVSGIASLLAGEGYQTAFFHGAQRGSMGFMAFARSTGFQEYYGREDYDADKRFGGDDDFDGMWAIWDEPFLQYYVDKMNDLPEPFLTAVFTATSHHPFHIPENYSSIYPEEALPIHKCIRYTDHALRRFFESASQQPWFKNTIFVFSADHTNKSNHDLYRTAMGAYRVPIFIYDPSGELPTGVMPGTAQQIDVLPTLLHILNYRKPFVAFGNDLLQTPPEDTWTINYANGVYQFTQRDTLVQFDGQSVVGVYDLRNDPYTRQTLLQAPKGAERRIKAIVQQYMQRMVDDRLSAENECNQKKKR